MKAHISHLFIAVFQTSLLLMTDNAQLAARLDELTAFVEKQSKIIARTGQQLIELQVRDVKTKFHSLDNAPQIDTSDFITNEDVIQLVAELQGQLDSLEERTIRRNINALVGSDGVLAPLSNKDGEYTELFPATVAELKALNKFEVVQLAEFFELVAVEDDNKELQSFLASENADESQKHLDSATAAPRAENLEDRVAAFSEEQLDAVFDLVARYIGARARRGKNAW